MRGEWREEQIFTGIWPIQFLPPVSHPLKKGKSTFVGEALTAWYLRAFFGGACFCDIR